MYYKDKQRLNFSLMVLAIAGVMASGYIIFQTYQNRLLPQPSSPFLKVGQETLYRDDYNRESNSYPLKIDDTAKNTIRTKMIEDSIILQAGQKEGLIELTSDIFNNRNKNYTNRLKAVELVKSKVGARQETITVELFALWFYNTQPAEIGLEKGKQIAFQKMSAIHSQLKTKKIDSKQAADLIKSDTSLAQLDKAYVSNAYSEVTATPEEHLTFDNEFDAKIRALQPGDITDLYLAKFSYKKDQPPSDVAYVIAKMVDKKNGVITSQTEWLQDYKKQYEVTVL